VDLSKQLRQSRRFVEDRNDDGKLTVIRNEVEGLTDRGRERLAPTWLFVIDKTYESTHADLVNLLQLVTAPMLPR